MNVPMPGGSSTDARVRRVAAASEALDGSAARLDALLALRERRARFYATRSATLRPRRAVSSSTWPRRCCEPPDCIANPPAKVTPAWLRWDFSFAGGPSTTPNHHLRRRWPRCSRHLDFSGSGPANLLNACDAARRADAPAARRHRPRFAAAPKEAGQYAAPAPELAAAEAAAIKSATLPPARIITSPLHAVERRLRPVIAVRRPSGCSNHVTWSRVTYCAQTRIGAEPRSRSRPAPTTRIIQRPTRPMPVIVHSTDHRAGTLDRVVAPWHDSFAGEHHAAPDRQSLLARRVFTLHRFRAASRSVELNFHSGLRSTVRLRGPLSGVAVGRRGMTLLVASTA